MGEKGKIQAKHKRLQATRSHVYKVVNSLCEQAGINKKIGTHTFKRSRAEHLLDIGIELTYVNRYIRHKNLTTTKYLDLSVAGIHRELDKINDPLEVII